MAGRARGGAAAGSLLSRRLHPAGLDRRHRVPQRGRRLRPPVQDRRRDADRHRRRSQTSRRAHRPHRVLHTWGSALTHHPHVHVIVPGGGLSPDGSRWIACRPGFFLPVRVLSRLFRRLFLDGRAALRAAGRLAFLGDLAPPQREERLRRRARAAAPLRVPSKWGVAIPTPHRPGRAGFPHPVLHGRVSLALA
jgi:hypothetical protein